MFSPYILAKSTRNECLLQGLRVVLTDRSPVVQKKINEVNTCYRRNQGGSMKTNIILKTINNSLARSALV